MKKLEVAVREAVREVQDFPIPGVNFKDISPIFLQPKLITEIVQEIANAWAGKGITKVMGIESRGFLLGPQIAQELDAGFVIVRKKGKLPPLTHSVSYSLEYGDATIEISQDSIVPGDLVLIHDDLLATGGTAAAAAKLVEDCGAKVAGYSFIFNLAFLKGKQKLSPISSNIHFIVEYLS